MSRHILHSSNFGHHQLKRSLGGYHKRENFVDEFSGSESSVLTLKEVGELKGHKGCVNVIAYNHSGDIIASGSDDGDVRLWNPYSLECLRVLKAHESNVFAADFFPFSDHLLVSGGNDAELKYYNLMDNSSTIYSHHDKKVLRVTVHPDFAFSFLSCSADGTVRQFDTRQQYDHSQIGTIDTVHSRDGEVLPQALGGGRGQIFRPNRNNNQNLITESLLVRYKTSRHLAALYSVDWNPVNSNQFIVGSELGDIRMFDLRMIKDFSHCSYINIFSHQPFGSSDDFTGCVYSKDGKYIVGTALGSLIYLFDANRNYERDYQLPLCLRRVGNESIPCNSKYHDYSEQVSINFIKRYYQHKNQESNSTDEDNDEDGGGDDTDDDDGDGGDRSNDDSDNDSEHHHHHHHHDEHSHDEHLMDTSQSEESSRESSVDPFHSDDPIPWTTITTTPSGNPLITINLATLSRLAAAVTSRRQPNNNQNNERNDDQNNENSGNNNPSNDAHRPNNGPQNASSSSNTNNTSESAGITASRDDESSSNAADSSFSAAPPDITTDDIVEMIQNSILQQTRSSSSSDQTVPANEETRKRRKQKSKKRKSSNSDSDDQQATSSNNKDKNQSSEQSESGHYQDGDSMDVVEKEEGREDGDQSSSIDSLDDSSDESNIKGFPTSYLQAYRGHSSVQTIKGCNFWGPRSEFVVSGSDDANVFVWKRDGTLLNILAGHDDIVNCVVGHPMKPMLATSGIDDVIKLWEPSGSYPTKEERIQHQKEMEDIVEQNERADHGGGRGIQCAQQ